LYLARIEITEVVSNQSDKALTHSINIGYLKSKYFRDIPSFKLYQSNRIYNVSIKDVTGTKLIRLNDIQDYQLLVHINKSLFTNLLHTWSESDFDCEKSLYGGFIVFLDKSNNLFLILRYNITCVKIRIFKLQATKLTGII